MDVRRMPIGVIVGAPLLIGLGVFAFTTQEPVTDPAASTPTSEATLDPYATPTIDEAGGYSPPPGALTAIAERWATETAAAIPPTATPVVAQRGDFRDGAWVRVNAGAGDCLNARNQPAVESDWVIVQACLPDGFEGLIAGTATEADGRWWWYLAGAGWVAEEWLEFIRVADLALPGAAEPQAPELTGAGRIAYIRDGDIWLMDADGDNQRPIIEVASGQPGDASYAYISNLRWSPDGTMLSYNVYSDGESKLHIDWVAPDGRVLRSERYAGVIAGGAAGTWSPDSTRIGVLLDAGPPEMGSTQGIPGTLEIATGLRSAFDSVPNYYSAMPEFNHDGTKLLYIRPAVATNDSAGGPPVEPAYIRIADAGGMEIDRVSIPTGGWISQPHWSPVDDRIAFHLSDGGDPTYVVYDLAQRRIVQRVPVPRTSDRIGGGCGGADMWRLDWNRDGTAILYSFSDGDTGANGVWTWDLAPAAATNTTRVTFAASAGAASPGSDGRFVFSTSGSRDAYIFWAREGDEFASIIAKGASPVWAP